MKYYLRPKAHDMERFHPKSVGKWQHWTFTLLGLAAGSPTKIWWLIMFIYPQHLPITSPVSVRIAKKKGKNFHFGRKLTKEFRQEGMIGRISREDARRPAFNLE
jgi:hypothetical protein